MQQFSPYQRAAKRRCEQIRDVSYLPDGKKAHRLDIFRPKQRQSLLPVLMYIHGGESAGGNLALALGVSACFERDEPAARMIWDTGVVPKVIMGLCGMLQVSDPHRLKNVCPPINSLSRTFSLNIARDVSRAYLGRGYRTARPESMLADPLLVMESDARPDRPMPATYAMVGTHDILLDDTRRLEEALNQRRIRNLVRYYPNEGHAFHLRGTSPQAADFWRDNLTFLHREMLRSQALKTY